MASSLRGQTFVCHRSFITPRRGSDQTKLETGATGVIHDSRTVQGEVWVKVSSKSHGTGYVPLDHVTVGSALTVHVLENHPYKCAQSYNNPRLNTDEILLVVGTEGKLEQVKADGKWAIVTDPRSRPARRGVVPLNCLEVGMSRRFGDLDVNVKGVLGAFSYKSTITSLNVPATESLFGKHVSGLLRAYYDKRVVLGLADSMTQYIRNDHAVAQTTAFIVKGCQISQQLANLNNPQVVWRDIRNASSGPVKTPARPDVDDIPTWEDINKGEGFYALFYSVFRSDPSKKPNGYIGQATGFGHRWDNHKKRMYAPDNAHYRNALDAKAYKAVELCRVTKCPVDIKFVVEQVFIDTFGSYNPRVLRTPSAGLLAPAPTASQQSTAGTIAGQTQHYIDAVNLTQIARAVGEQTGWVPLFARPGFGADQGFNWASPITESVRRASMLWIKQRFPNGYTLYTRSVCKMAKSGVALSCLAIGSTGPTVKIELNAKDAKPFVQGDSVYPAFELAPEGVRHEHQYARVGRAGKSDFLLKV